MKARQAEANTPQLLYVGSGQDLREILTGLAGSGSCPDLAILMEAEDDAAWQVFREHRPQLVMIELERSSAIRLAGEMRALEPETVLVAVAGQGDAPSLFQAMEAGIVHFVPKPVTPEHLSEILKQCLAIAKEREAQRSPDFMADYNSLEEKNRRLRRILRESKRTRYRYWNLYSWSPVGFVALDNELAIRELNMSAARLLGGKRVDLIGTSLDRHLSADNRALLVQSFQNCLNSRHEEVEIKFMLQESRSLYVQLHCEPYHLHGKVDKLYRMAIIDISRLKQVESSLHRLNRLYEVLSQTNNAIIHAVERDQLFDEICRTAVEKGGFRRACIGWLNRSNGMIHSVATSAAGDTHGGGDSCVCFHENLYGPGAISTALRENGYFVSNRCLTDQATQYLHDRGEQLGIRSMAAFVLSIEGQTVGVFNLSAGEEDFFDQQLLDLLRQMAADISFALEHMRNEELRRQAEEALRKETLEKLEAVEQLRQRDQLLLQQSRQAAMGELLGNIAHHWRQPLNVVALIIQDLALQYDDEGLTHESIHASTDKAMQVILQLSKTINDFSTFFRPDHTKSLFRLNDALERTMSLLEANFKRLMIDITVTADGEHFVTGYQNEFSQALLNILMNARDALIERAIAQPHIRIRLFKADHGVVLTIADNAGGIGSDVLSRIFDPYFTTKGPDRGTGIGLYMAKMVIEKTMDGRLSVCNAEEGAEFRIELNS